MLAQRFSGETALCQDAVGSAQRPGVVCQGDEGKGALRSPGLATADKQEEGPPLGRDEHAVGGAPVV